MNNVKKITSLTILSAFIGLQCGILQPATAQEYKITPPTLDENSQMTLPSVPSLSPVDSGAPLKGQVSTIPANTTFEVATNSLVTTAASQVGEVFTATLTKPIAVSGNTVIPAGSEAIGQITYIEPAGRANKGARLEIRFTGFKLANGQKVAIMGKVLTKNNGLLKSGSIPKQILKGTATEVVTTGTGAVGGVILGSLVVGSIGAWTLIGTAAGGVLGLGYIMGKKGKEVVVPSGTRLNVTLEQPASIGYN